MASVKWAAIVASAVAGIASAADFSTYSVGNSLTDDMTYGFKYFATDHTTRQGGTYNWGIDYKGGTSLSTLDRVPDDNDPSANGIQSRTGVNTTVVSQVDPNNITWKTSLAPTNHWDAVTLELYPSAANETPLATQGSDTAAINGFISYNNHNSSRYLIFQPWQNLINSTDAANFHTLWTAPTPNSSSQLTLMTSAYSKNVFNAVKSTNPDIAMIPAGDVFDALFTKMKQGADLGITDIRQLYRDQKHLSVLGRDIAGYTAYAVIFGQSPVGLDPNLDPTLYQNISWGTLTYSDNTTYNFTEPHPTSAEMTAIQQTVWDVVNAERAYTAVPEPAAASLLVIGALVLMARRPTKRASNLVVPNGTQTIGQNCNHIV
jgi:hypothetical protein